MDYFTHIDGLFSTYSIYILGMCTR